MNQYLWDLFLEIKHKERYTSMYQLHVTRINNIISGICAVFSAGSVAAWPFWSLRPALWTALICVIQAVQIFRPYLPFGQRSAALKYFIPDLRMLLVDLEYDLNSSPSLSDERCLEITKDYVRRYEALYAKYLGDREIPRNRSVDKAAGKECKYYFSLHYHITEWRNLDA